MDDNNLDLFIEALHEQEMDALQLAVLLGDNFSLDIILDMIDISPSKLLDLIDKLFINFLIKNKPDGIKGSYVFTPSQLPARVIASMPNDKKKLYISNIINYFERQFPQTNEKAKVLVGLILRFKQELDNLQYLKKAADILVSDHQTEQALNLYREVIDSLLGKNREPMEDVLFIDTVIAYAPIATNIYRPDDIFPVLEKALNLSTNLQNKRAEAMVEFCLGRLFQRQGKSAKAAIHYDRGWSLSQNMNDEGLKKLAAKLYALALFWQGRITEATRVYEETLSNIEDISSDLRDVWSYLLLALCYGIAGRTGRGIGLAEALMSRAVSKGYKKTIAFSHTIIAMLLLDIRKFEEAEPHINKAIELGEKIKSDFALFLAKLCKGFIEYNKGNIPKCKELLEAGLDHLADKSTFHYSSPWLIEVLLGFHQANLEPPKGYSFTSELNRLLAWPDIYMRGAALRYSALSKDLNKGPFHKIESLLFESAELLQKAGASIELGKTYAEIAKLYIKKNDLTKATEFAEIAYRNLSEIDNTLFPPQLSFLITKKTIEHHKEEGIRALENAIDCLPDFEKYIGQVVTILTDMFGAERTAILLAKRDMPKSLSVVATRNFTAEEVERLGMDELQSLFLSLVQNGPVVIIDQQKTTKFTQLAQHHITSKSIALTPITSNRTVIGLIYIDNRLLKGIFTKRDKITLKAISGQISLALKTSDLYDKFGNLHFDISDENQKIALFEETESAFPTIIGKSKILKDLLLKVKKVGRSDTTVLIYGETGVGKELIAKAIHQYSDRSDKPLIYFNISALSDNLIAAELFGYEKGAYTGAVSSKPGRFELANGGTIFLDEIGELSMDSQVKLLRVLQEGKFERVGSNQPIYSDFRIIAATNKDLNQMIQKGLFRSDLYYRISSFPLEIPPLRERKEDIPYLITYFMKKYALKNKKSIKKIFTHDMEKLQAYAWPGNIRELEHLIERAVIISTGEYLIIPDFLPDYGGDNSLPNENREGFLPLEDIQRRHILRVLEHTKGKIRGEDGAAKILGLKPTTLEFRIKQLNIK
ncbi:MAG: sigma 54-interacting transcriptional regulator [Desulfobacterales bacterium]|jgi:transcriptional regulator with GAF, ATPase, and Fis domain|nr:sigma 54-interacting transcriptional regulator [Desulfobacterales bacterium]